MSGEMGLDVLGIYLRVRICVIFFLNFCIKLRLDLCLYLHLCLRCMDKGEHGSETELTPVLTPVITRLLLPVFPPVISPTDTKGQLDTGKDP